MTSYQVGKVDIIKEHNSDGSSRHQTAMENSIVRIPTEEGYNTITLSSAILVEDNTAVCVTKSIMRTFKEGQDLLDF